MGANNIPESCCLKYVLRPLFPCFTFSREIFLSSAHLMRKDREGFCFAGFSYGIINILLTSSQRIIPSQAWHNSCSWPPATAKHPRNKFRLPARKKKSILQLIQGGGGDDHTQVGSTSPGAPKRRSKKKCPDVTRHVDLEQMAKWLPPQQPSA